MDPIPQMVIETPAARRKGELVITPANLEELRAQLDAAERMILAAQRALEPEPVRDPAVTAKIAGLGEQVRALSEPAPEPEREAVSDVTLACGDQVTGDWQVGDTSAAALPAGTPVRCLRHGATVILRPDEPPARTAELVPLDESLPWAASPREWCGWSGPDGEHCLLAPHGPREMHAAPIGAGSMRRWPALRSVTA